MRRYSWTGGLRHFLVLVSAIVILSVWITHRADLAAATQTGPALFQYGVFATSNACGSVTLTGTITGEAGSFYRRSLAIQEKSLGPSHPDLAYTLRAYALLLQETKRKSEAAGMDARAHAILARNPALRSAYQTVDVRDLDRSGKGWRD